MSPERVEAVLDEFRGWLNETATATASDQTPPATVDLFTLVGQFTALRHEVNMQTKATRSLIEQAAEERKPSEKKQPPVDPNELVRPLVKALIDVADALALGLKNVEKLRVGLQLQIDGLVEPVPEPPTIAKPGFFARLVGTTADQQLGEWAMKANAQREATIAKSDSIRPLLTGLSDGYSLSLRRVERVLPTFGLEPFVVTGQPFDPETMEVVEVIDASNKPSGMVVDEVRRGYRWNDRLFRYAQVTVAR